MDINLFIAFTAGIILGAIAGFIGFNLTSKQSDNNSGIDEQIKEHVIALTEQLKLLKEDRKILEAKSQHLSDDLIKEKERSATLLTNNQNLSERLEQQKASLEKSQEQLRIQFENLANKLLEQNANKFNEASSKSLEAILSPLKENLTGFHKKIDESFGKQAKETFSLKEQIQNIVSMNDKMSEETGNLTKALRGESKTQGDWGEVILERILESSGLREGEEYTTQGRNMGLRDDDNNLLKPDVIIELPDNKHIIVDSKASLTHYNEYVNTEDSPLKDAALKNFIGSVKNHVKELAGKKYEHLEKLNAPDFVIMFMPIEGSFSLAVQSDKELLNFAWDKRIAIVSPSTMFATLQTVSSIWRLEQQNKNTMEIARQGGALYDKFVGFIDDMQDIEKHLTKTGKSFSSAMNKLSEGKDNLVTKAEKIRALGVKTKKSLPKELIADDTNLLYSDADEGANATKELQEE
ncbi:MAG: DNA recombination protein RmuC [Alphaproteobacteria bacterium]|nr:DNA recombination protein RmuC [Alphaproteobacteria bacterium]